MCYIHAIGLGLHKSDSEPEVYFVLSPILHIKWCALLFETA